MFVFPLKNLACKGLNWEGGQPTKKTPSYYTLRFNEVERGVYWFHVVRPSVRPSVDRMVSIL